jgi:hypothetical protein
MATAKRINENICKKKEEEGSDVLSIGPGSAVL